MASLTAAETKRPSTSGSTGGSADRPPLVRSTSADVAAYFAQDRIASNTRRIGELEQREHDSGRQRAELKQTVSQLFAAIQAIQKQQGGMPPQVGPCGCRGLLFCGGRGGLSESLLRAVGSV